ncbi:hypothetical protein ACWDA3_26190 [Nonomuraea rubra]
MAKDQIPELRELRDQYDKARAALFAGIREQLRKQEPLAKIGRSVDWSSEYIAKIRDGKVND